MRRGAAGTSGEAQLTSGEPAVTSGYPPEIRRRALIAAVLFFAAVQSAVNGMSRASDMRGAGADVHSWMIAIDESTSLIAWIVSMVVIWHLVAKVRPPRFGWPATMFLHVLATLPVSLLHVGLMVLFREGAYAIGGVEYVFGGDNPGQEFLYEYRKDLPVYFLLAAAFAGIQWATRPARAPEDAKILSIQDGSRRVRLPHAQIDRVEAAGNYVEVHARGAVHLHRATMSAISAELGPAFVRIHRSRIVRRELIRTTEGLPSGDFNVTLADGTHLRGSRRYRDTLG